MANESMISLNVNLGSTKNVTDEFNALIKVLETKKIKLEVDTSSLQASLKLASSEIEKSYSKIKDTVKKANDEISKPAKGNNSGLSELEKQIASAEKAISKFTDTKNKQLNNILAGNNGTMIPNLTEYDTLVTKMNELKNIKLDSTNVDTYTKNVKEVQTAYDELTTKIKQVNSTSKEMNSSVKMSSDITNKVRDYNTQLEVMRQKNADIINNPIYQQIANDVNKLSQANQPLKQLSNETNTIDNNMKQLRNSMTQVGSMGGVFSKLGQSIKSAFSFMSASMVFYQLANQIREIPSEIRKLDTAFVDLKKTTSMTTSELDEFYKSSNEIAKQLGVTTEGIINQASAWSRLGYSTKEQAETMAQVSAIFSSISPDMSMDEATDGLVSTMKAYKIEASEALDSVASKINVIGNTQAVNNKDIVDFLTRSSSAMEEANNTLDQSIALGTAITEITRDASSAGQVMKTVSMRIRGYSEETEAYTEDVEVLSGTIADLTKTASTPGGISLFTDETKETYKSTYELLEDISEIYENLTDYQQASLLEALAGKRNGQAVAAALNNFEAAQKSMETMANSQGEAMKEMEIIYDSIDYKMNRLKETWVGLAQDFIERDTFKGLIDGTTSILNFIESCGGLESIVLSVVTSMVALKVATASINTGSVVSGIQSVIAAFTARKVITDANTASTLALSAAEKTLVGAAVIAGIFAVGYGIKKLDGHYKDVNSTIEKAQSKVRSLNEELNNTSKGREEVADLVEEYKKLRSEMDNGNLKTDELEEYYNVQNKLKELFPELNGYYDVNNNFIVNQGKNISSIMADYEEYLKAKERDVQLSAELAIAKQNEEFGNILQWRKSVEDTMKAIEDDQKGLTISPEVEANLGIEWGEYLGGGDVSSIVANLKGQLGDIDSKVNEFGQSYRDAIISIMKQTDDWYDLSEKDIQGINKYFGEMSFEDLKIAYQQAKGDTVAFLDSIMKIPEVMEDSSGSIDIDMGGATSIIKSADDAFQSMLSSMEDNVKNTDILKMALNELNSDMGISAETSKELSEQYPKIFEGCTTAADGIMALNKQLTVNEFDETTDKISSLSSVLENLKENNGLTASSFKTISDEFPDLLDYMDDEVALSEEVMKKMDDLKQSQNRAYSDMLADSEQYYAQKISKDSGWVTATENNLNQLLSSLGVGYEADLKNYTSLENGKKIITANLIKELGEAWAEYFGMIADGMSLGDIEETMYINGDESMGTNMNYEAYNQAKKIHDVFENLSNSFATVGEKFNTGLGTKSSKSSSSEKYAEYIDSIYDSILNSLQEGTDKIDRQIAISQSKLENLELFGNQEDITNANAELEKLYQDRIDIMKNSSSQMVSLRNKMAKELQATGYEEIKGLDLTNISQLGVDKIINNLEKQIDVANKANDSKLAASLTYKKNLIEDYTGNIINANSEINSMAKSIMDAQNELGNTVIDNIKRITEFDKQRYDDKLKLIELEQISLDEDSKEYKAKEQEKINMLIELQKGYQASITQLKAQGKTNDQEDVREYVNLYTDAEIEILNIKKAMAEKERQLQIKASQDMVTALEKQKKALEERTNLVMDMIKKEQELRKKAINEEIDGYEKIIAARKKSITDEQDETSYNEELSEKQKVVTDLESKLLALQNDNSESAKAQRLKLEEDLAKARKDVNKLQLDKQTDDRINALDEELEAFKDEKQEELDEIEDYLSKEGQIRSDAMKRIEQEGKSMYNSLKRYNAEYGTLAESELESLWETATTSVNGYIDSNKSLLEIMKDITAEINRQTTLQGKLETDNWQTFVPSTNTSTSTGTSNSTNNNNLDVITKMMENASTWKTASKDKQLQLAQENQTLGAKIGAFYDTATGTWYTDSTKRKKLFDVSSYHTGGIVSGLKLKSNEEFAKLLKGEVVVNSSQIENFMNKTLPSISNGNTRSGNAEITLNIAKLIDVAKLDNSTDIEGIVGRAVKETMKQLNDGLSSIGLRPNLR